MRATVAGLTSNAPAVAASVQPGPASPWLALSRMRAWVRALAGATPRPIMVCSRARSSSDRTTTCRLRTSASCSVGPPKPHEDEGQPPTAQLKADDLLVHLVHVWSTRHRSRAVRNGLQRCMVRPGCRCDPGETGRGAGHPD